MKISVSAKSVLAKILGSSGILEKTIRNRSGKGYVILMYHRILPSDQAKPRVQPGMYVDPETFEMHIRYLKQYFQMVSLSEKFSIIQTAKNSHSIRPSCILTFDDGWRDFYEFAYPVLKRNQVPATVFLPTGYVGTSDWFWTDRLAGLLTNAIPPASPEKPGNPLLEGIAGIRGVYEERLEAAIHLMKNRNDQEIEDVIAALKERVGIVATPNQRVFLNWEEVREMRGSGLVSFGSHTHNHRILVHLKEEEVREELVLSKKILLREGVVDPSFIPFCYPNGNSNQRIVCMVQEAGYHAAVSTGNGWNDGDASPFELKRVAIHQDMTASREMFGCRVVDIL
jgi:peptidoglycan/xylan/chitin deacetylase (PgdA/CDA1 family)